MTIQRAADERELAAIAHELHQRAVRLLQAWFATGLELVRVLERIRREQLYRYLGYDSFEEYLAAPDLGWSLRTYQRFRALAEWAERRAIPDERLARIGVRKAEALAQHDLLLTASVPDQNEQRRVLDELLDEAEQTAYRDFVVRVRERLGGDAERAELALLRQEAHAYFQSVMERIRFERRLVPVFADVLEYVPQFLARARVLEQWHAGGAEEDERDW
ncbi:MAG: hypothetical protein NZ761_06215 [Dehalococcoidia bacterium]|nr:hypothetical protein [Dehalococcoidia bacterium]